MTPCRLPGASSRKDPGLKSPLSINRSDFVIRYVSVDPQEELSADAPMAHRSSVGGEPV